MMKKYLVVSHYNGFEKDNVITEVDNLDSALDELVSYIEQRSDLREFCQATIDKMKLGSIDKETCLSTLSYILLPYSFNIEIVNVEGVIDGELFDETLNEDLLVVVDKDNNVKYVTNENIKSDSLVAFLKRSMEALKISEVQREELGNKINSISEVAGIDTLTSLQSFNYIIQRNGFRSFIY